MTGDQAPTLPVLVTGATGNVGRAVVTSLRAAGIPVRAAVLVGVGSGGYRLGGPPDTTSGAADLGDVETVTLDFHDATTFRPALTGVGGVFLLRPPSIARVGPTLNALIDIAADVGVEHVVLSSVAGADTNRLVPHHRVERHLQASSLPWTILRPGFFAQNLGDAYRRDICDDDRLYVPAGDGRVAFLDVRDLADVAAAVFKDPALHRWRAYTLTGPDAVTFTEAAQVLTSELRRPIRYDPATATGYVRHSRSRGLPAAQIAVQLALHLGLRRGAAAAVDTTLAGLLGRPGRPLATYIADHRALWQPDASVPGETPSIERVHPPAALMRVANPVMRRLLASRAHRLVSGQLLVLHYHGRRTGTRYDVPVGYRTHHGALEVLTNSGWRVNFRGGRDIEVTHRGQRRRAHAVTIEDPPTVAATYNELIADLGVQQAQRRLGIRITGDRPPTADELADAVQRLGMSIVRIQVN